MSSRMGPCEPVPLLQGVGTVRSSAVVSAPVQRLAIEVWGSLPWFSIDLCGAITAMRRGQLGLTVWALCDIISAYFTGRTVSRRSY